MPVKTCLSSVLSTRFDFGVPLEDIFPPNDIHPRLQYLFGKAYESCVKLECSIEDILRQGTVNERLTLKEKLVLDVDYHISPEEFSPGTYFWVIRHFLGLLPLPLLPEYTDGIQFHWGNCAYECKNWLRNDGIDHKDKLAFDYEIAETINMLPFENFVLLNMLIAFIRKLSTKHIRGRQTLNRKSMLVLAKYYCPSIFVRPFRPGHCLKNDSHLPLLLYLTVRWQKISKHCEAIGHPAFFLECDIKQKSIAFFNRDVISMCRNIPYFANICKDYLRDVSCQTYTDLCGEKNSQRYCPVVEESEKGVVNSDDKGEGRANVNDTEAYKLAYIEEEPRPLLKTDVENDNDKTLYQTAIDFSYSSVPNREQPLDWPNIVKETMDTVKRVEESYIYDDYDTFGKEDFNQIGKSSFLSRISKYGFSYTSPKNSARDKIRKTSTPAKESPESENSYVKYPDVCEGVDIEEYKVKRSESKIKPQNSVSHKLCQDDDLVDQADNSKQDLHNASRSRKRKKYLLKKIRLSLEFLKTLTPKKSTFNRIGSKVKYHRMKNGKSNTI